jgi:hypothetical protein
LQYRKDVLATPYRAHRLKDVATAKVGEMIREFDLVKLAAISVGGDKAQVGTLSAHHLPLRLGRACADSIVSDVLLPTPQAPRASRNGDH